MTTVATFSKPEEAHLARCRLESAGIRVCVRDEFTVQMVWLYSTALGGVRVEVPDRQVKAARELLDLPPVEGSMEAEVRCPRCGSSEVSRHEWPRRFAYLTLLLASFPLLLSGKRWKCGDCRLTWR